jgi:hypothetical protein
MTKKMHNHAKRTKVIQQEATGMTTNPFITSKRS